MNQSSFTESERAYLAGLPAVSQVFKTRIEYDEGFKRVALERYLNGEKPGVIFRSAGLDSMIIGGKRIERCFARWRRNQDAILKQPPDSNPDRYFIRSRQDVLDRRDTRDILIAQLVRRIDELEHENKKLKEELGQRGPIEGDE